MARFQKGQSGNPAGRPPGMKDKRTALRQLLDGRSVELLNKACDMALAGDTRILAALISRLIPPPRPEIALASVLSDSMTLTEQSMEILFSALSGKISPTAASELCQVLVLHQRICESDQLVRRIERLEAEVNA